MPLLFLFIYDNSNNTNMTFGICQRYDIVALVPWYIQLSTAAGYPSLLPTPDHDR